MKRFQHVVAYLTLDDADAAVLAWAANLVRLAGATRLTLLHAWQPVEIPAGLQETYPWLLTPGLDVARARMHALTERHLALDRSVIVEPIVRQGSPLGELLECLLRVEADLVLCGTARGGGVLVEKLARKAPCSLVSVPPRARPAFRRVLAAVDYSSFSGEALNVAAAFAAAGGAELTVLHAYEIPWGHNRAMVSTEELRRDLRLFHEQRLRAFAAEAGIQGLAPRYVLRESPLTAVTICDELESGGHDLLTIGCRGHHAIYATLLGSCAETILRNSPAPVVAVKAKASTAVLLEALRNN